MGHRSQRINAKFGFDGGFHRTVSGFHEGFNLEDFPVD